MVFRISKIILVVCAGIYTSLIVFNNLTDYESNYQFVSHVLSMDDTFQRNQGSWRSISHPVAHHFFFWIIILLEMFIAFCCILGAVKLWKARKEDIAVFNRAKQYAVWGLTLGIALWFLGFIGIAGEWFLMWQSADWNATPAVFRIAAIFFLLLLFVANRNEAL